jgi:hypothetical protein
MRLVLIGAIAAVGAGSAVAQYVLVVGNTNSGRVDLLNMDRNGVISARSHFDTWLDTVAYGDPSDFAVSRNGRYVYFYDFGHYNGALYAVSEDASLHFVQEILPSYGEAAGGGGGFTFDERYLLTRSSFGAEWPPRSVLMTYRLDGYNCELVTSQTVPNDHTLTAVFLSNRHDEIMASSRSGNVGTPDGFSVYHFDRVREQLEFKQNIPDVACLFNAMSEDGNFKGYTWGTNIGTMVRGEDTSWTLCSDYWTADW